MADPPAKDNEYYEQYIKVDGQHIVIKINGETTVDYVEPTDQEPESTEFLSECRLGSGTFALQAHDPESKVYFKNIRVRRLP